MLLLLQIAVAAPPHFACQNTNFAFCRIGRWKKAVRAGTRAFVKNSLTNVKCVKKLRSILFEDEPEVSMTSESISVYFPCVGR